eukprot:EG_transcript_20986
MKAHCPKGQAFVYERWKTTRKQCTVDEKCFFGVLKAAERCLHCWLIRLGCGIILITADHCRSAGPMHHPPGADANAFRGSVSPSCPPPISDFCWYRFSLVQRQNCSQVGVASGL